MQVNIPVSGVIPRAEFAYDDNRAWWVPVIVVQVAGTDGEDPYVEKVWTGETGHELEHEAAERAGEKLAGALRALLSQNPAER